jgi:hypothetical protein
MSRGADSSDHRRALPVLRRRFLGLAALPLLAVACLAAAPGAQAGFAAKPLDPSPGTRLFDLGVVDYDSDGRLDIFAVNHALPGALLRNRGGWRWRDRIGEAGLSANAAYPGFEDMFAPPPASRGPGLYVFVQRDRIKLPEVRKTKIHLRADAVPIEGRLVFEPPRPHDPPSARNGTITERRLDDRVVFEFSLQPGGEAVIPASVLNLPVPVRAELPRGAGLYMGARAVRAPGNAAAFELLDRHGWAFADIDGDGSADLLDVVGGLGNLINRPTFRGRIFDRVYLRRPGGRFVRSEIRLDKDNCRGRDAAAVDINADGLLDLFTSCEEAPAVAYMRQPDGSFRREVVPDSRGAAHRWVQLDRDRRPELVVADRSVRVLERGPGGWSRVSAAPLRPWASKRLSFEDPRVQNLAVGDFDGDGDADLFSASKRGNSLLVNRGGKLRAVKPQRKGLPRASGGASWVDVNNRGRLDLHTLPDGLYRAEGKRWRRTGRLGVGRSATNAIVNWADFDNDGRRDVLLAHGAGRFAANHRVKLRRNTGRSGRWLQVETPSGELGAEIVVRSKKRRLVGWSGDAEGSHYSQGHGRTYFGLGQRGGRRARVTVRWTGGGKTRRKVATNRIVRIAP